MGSGNPTHGGTTPLTLLLVCTSLEASTASVIGNVSISYKSFLFVLILKTEKTKQNDLMFKVSFCDVFYVGIDLALAQEPIGYSMGQI